MLCEIFNLNYMYVSWMLSFVKWRDIIESDFLKILVWYYISIFEKLFLKLYLVKFDKILEKDVWMYKYVYFDCYFLGRFLDFRI